ncbi:hypothetical protein LTR86_003991 [Recurvomyces mirabilis]|nr:hypothetical protein LTR86_003991 [Recurvomyces mirabilis]
MSTTPPQVRKRKAAIHESGTSTAKRARNNASTNTATSDEENVWESIVEDMETVTPAREDSAPPSPAYSIPSSVGQSIAETTATSTSKRPKKFLCEVAGCGKAFDRPARVQIHMRSHTNERPFSCSEEGCGKTFLRNEHLTRHTIDVHSEARDHVCTHVISTDDSGNEVTCGKTFTTATRLRRHLAAHEAKEETTCTHPGCGKVFRKQETLQRHIKTDHLNEKPFECSHMEMLSNGEVEECHASFSKPEQLKNHVAREHSGVRYFCDICSPASSSSTSDLDFDMLQAPTERVGFSTYTELQQHLRLAHPPTCAQCGKQRETNRALKAHMDIEHSALSERQTHICDWPGCGRGFTKSGNLKVHYQSVHKKSRSFICGETNLESSTKVEGWNRVGCGHGFGTKANLEEHIRTQHLGIPAKIKPVRLRKKAIKAEEDASTAMTTPTEWDEVLTPADDIVTETLAMITGHGYDSLPNRSIACLVSGCQHRFATEYHLSEHLDVTHGWQIDDINDRIAERDALAGGDFWVGGAENLADPGVDEQEEVLRRSLTAALVGDPGRERKSMVEQEAGRVEERELMGRQLERMQGLMIDPALTETS